MSCSGCARLAIDLGTGLPRFARNAVGRDFAVGDIHGCFGHLSRSLEAIGFDASVDRLFSVGDLVDRGPESHLVLEWLDRPWFFSICGNHDFMTWRSALGRPYPQVDHLTHGGGWLGKLSVDEGRRIGEGLAALPLAMEVETAAGLVGMVHADCPFDDWQEMQAVPWGSVEPTSSLGDCCLWSFERYTRRYAAPIRNVRAVVHGHVAIKAPEVLGNVHFIDTGGWRPGGCFTFLELATLEAVGGPVAAGMTATSLSRRNR